MYIGSCSGVFYAVDRKSGTVRWSYDTGIDGEPAQFHGDPVVAGDLVITGCDLTSLPHTYAFERESGELRWKSARSVLESDIVDFGGTVIGRRWNGDLLALDAGDGQLRWSVQPVDYTYRFRSDDSPIENGGIVFFGGVDGHVYAVAAETGRVVWRRDLGDAITTSSVTGGDDVYVGAAGGGLFRISAADGSLLAERSAAGRPIGRPALSAEVVIFLISDVGLVAYDRALAEVRWSKRAASTWRSLQPIIWRDMVVAGTADGQVLGYRIADDTEALSHDVGDVVRGLGADQETLYIGTFGGTLHAWRPRSRQEKQCRWHLFLTELL